MADETEATERGDGRSRIWLIAAGVLAFALVAFVVQNTESVSVHWLFFDVEAPLWLVLLITVAAALVLGEIVTALVRRSRQRRKDARKKR